MTMLDRMRRHRGWLKWSLALVVLAFIVFYIPDFLDPGTGPSPNEVVARVGDEAITASTFRRAYLAQMQAYQRAYGSGINEQLLRQMGIEQQILQQLIEERAALAEAQRLGLTVTDQEVAQRIYAIPAFQQNGQFAGRQAYEQVLRMQRPPLTTAEFEENLRRALLVEKLRSAVTDWVSVSDAEIEREYHRRNEKVKLDLVVFSADAMRPQATVSDAEVAALFDKNKEQYRLPAKRKIKYLLVDVEALKAKVTVAPADVESHYRENITQYSTPEQVRASHILLKTEGKDEAAVRTQAEDLLKQVKGGADFAALATKFSEDEASKAQGGDLDYFGRNRMVKEFEDVAFALPPGETSDIVKSQFGFHIIKVTDKRAASTRSLDDVRAQIADQLGWERAQAQAAELAAALDKEIDDVADLERVGKARGLPVKESGFFAKDEPIAEIGPAPEVAERAFTLEQQRVAGPERVGRGSVFFATTGAQEPRLPSLDEVKNKVRDDAVKQKAQELSRKRAQELAGSFTANFAAAAKSAGLEVKTTELVARSAALPEVGVSPAVDAAAFGLPTGGVTAPVETDAGTVIAKVVERQDVIPDAMRAARGDLKREVLNEQRSRFFSAYMLKARERMKTEIDQESVRRVLGA